MTDRRRPPGRDTAAVSSADEPGRDWHAWARRIEDLAAALGEAGPADEHSRDQFGRQSLREALAQAYSVLGDVEQATRPTLLDELEGHDASVARRVYEAAMLAGSAPLWTSMTRLGRDMMLDGESVRFGLVQLHRRGHVRLTRYINGHPIDIDPAHILADGQFHLTLVLGDADDPR